jgi:hypothetical protein
MEAASDTLQTAIAGTLVPSSPSLRVLDRNGRPVPNVKVVFVVTVGKGTLSSTYANTNALGIATVSWTLGTDPGPNWMIGSVAAWERSLLYFKATGTPP